MILIVLGGLGLGVLAYCLGREHGESNARFAVLEDAVKHGAAEWCCLDCQYVRWTPWPREALSHDCNWWMDRQYNLKRRGTVGREEGLP